MPYYIFVYCVSYVDTPHIWSRSALVHSPPQASSLNHTPYPSHIVIFNQNSRRSKTMSFVAKEFILNLLSNPVDRSTVQVELVHDNAAGHGSKIILSDNSIPSLVDCSSGDNSAEVHASNIGSIELCQRRLYPKDCDIPCCGRLVKIINVSRWESLPCSHTKRPHLANGALTLHHIPHLSSIAAPKAPQRRNSFGESNTATSMSHKPQEMISASSSNIFKGKRRVEMSTRYPNFKT